MKNRHCRVMCVFKRQRGNSEFFVGSKGSKSILLVNDFVINFGGVPMEYIGRNHDNGQFEFKN